MFAVVGMFLITLFVVGIVRWLQIHHAATPMQRSANRAASSLWLVPHSFDFRSAPQRPGELPGGAVDPGTGALRELVVADARNE
eukprot:CAMPEP_0180251746 /NCGR_PEP_ID=MMETSP0987-20121128/38609_1 /TAXON_ID=697907 /ORGANISM="non described non described, Strain CCMP2293" /LENGTH=83 /DNA_ID=CAMNT_0022220323 /DNA_START=20 /DNA_END=268 /DNA_ORIENTATION=+